MYPIWAPLMNLADRGPASHPSCRWSTFGDTPMYTRMMPNWRWSWIRLGNCGVRLLAHRSIGRLLGTDQGYSDLCALLPVGWAGLRRAVSRADEKCLSSTCGQLWTEYSISVHPSAFSGCCRRVHRSPDPTTLSKGSNKGRCRLCWRRALVGPSHYSTIWIGFMTLEYIIWVSWTK